jgi:LysM repeat protein
MEVLMARFSRSRTSRTVVSVVVIAITVGAAFQFHRVRKSDAITPPPLQMSVEQSGGAITLVKNPQSAAAPTPGNLIAPPTAPVINTLITQTPDQTHKQAVPTVPVTTTTTPNKTAITAPVAKPLSASGSVPVAAGTVLADASAKVTAGDLLGAREELNSALLTGSLSATDADAVKKQIAEINQTVVFSPRQFPKDPLGGVYVVKSGDRMSSIGNSHEIPYELLLPLNRMTDARKLRYGQTLKVINGPFHAVVTKSKFTLDVYLGSPGGADSTYITTFMVGLGTDNSTPTGTWSIKNKVPGPAYFPPEGHPGPVIAPGDPKNPLGAFWMGLEGTDGQAVGQRSYGIHGTIDPTSIGKQSSMGCIRLKNEDVEVLYKMLMQGKSTVIVKD